MYFPIFTGLGAYFSLIAMHYFIHCLYHIVVFKLDLYYFVWQILWGGGGNWLRCVVENRPIGLTKNRHGQFILSLVS